MLDRADQKLMTIAEASEFLRVSPATCRRLIREGVVPVIEISPRIRRVPVSALVNKLNMEDAWPIPDNEDEQEEKDPADVVAEQEMAR